MTSAPRSSEVGEKCALGSDRHHQDAHRGHRGVRILGTLHHETVDRGGSRGDHADELAPRFEPFGEQVRAFPFHFDERDKLRVSLREVQTLINWRGAPQTKSSLPSHEKSPCFPALLSRASLIRILDPLNAAQKLDLSATCFTGQGFGCGIGVKRPIISVSPGLGCWACRMVGLFVGDVVITREEIRGLMEGRLCVDAPRLGTTKLTEWIDHHRDTLGRRYTSEMARRVDRASEYRSN